MSRAERRAARRGAALHSESDCSRGRYGNRMPAQHCVYKLAITDCMFKGGKSRFFIIINKTVKTEFHKFTAAPPPSHSVITQIGPFVNLYNLAILPELEIGQSFLNRFHHNHNREGCKQSLGKATKRPEMHHKCMRCGLKRAAEGSSRTCSSRCGTTELIISDQHDIKGLMAKVRVLSGKHMFGAPTRN